MDGATPFLEAICNFNLVNREIQNELTKPKQRARSNTAAGRPQRS